MRIANVLTLIFIVVPTFSAKATSFLNLADVVEDATLIALAKWVSVEHEPFRFKGGFYSCGNHITIDVVDSLKGEKGRVSFFSGVGMSGDLPFELGAEFFVVLRPFEHDWNEERTSYAQLGFPKVMIAESKCAEKAKSKYLSGDFTDLLDWVVPVEPEANKQFGGKWLRHDTIFNLYGSNRIKEETVLMGGTEINPGRYFQVVNWADVRHTAVQLIGRN